MNKYSIEFSTGTTSIYEENDIIQLVVCRGFMTPTISKKKEKENNFYYVQTFDIANMKTIVKKFFINKDKNAEQNAINFSNSFDKYDPNNISKYIVNVKISDIFKRQKYFERNFRYLKPIIKYDQVELPVDPYIFGIWLGDGNSANCGITNIDIEIIEAYTTYANSLGLKVNNTGIRYMATNNRRKGILTNSEKILNIISDFDKLNLIDEPINDNSLLIIVEKYNVHIKTIKKYKKIYEIDGIEGIKKIIKEYELNPFTLKLKNLDVILNKHIPEIYKKNSVENRLQLLAGFIDSDGYLHNASSYEISQCQKNVKIFDDIKEVSESLGFTMSRKECNKTVIYKDIKKECPTILGCISGDVFKIPVRIERKKMTKIKSQRYDLAKFKISLI